jgi:4-amino-4-deoxy-L-arabinose transferase-like glycosyltransferase
MLALLLCALAFWLVQATTRRQINIGLSLAGLLLLGYTLTMVVGLGPERLEQSFNQSRMSVFLHKACQVGGAGDVIRNYEADHTDHNWTSTKPPGLLAFYTLARQALVLDTSLSPAECHQQFSRGMSWLAPLLSTLVALPLYFLGRTLIGNRGAWLASALYLTTTSFVKFSRFTDATLYPLLTLAVLAALYLALRHRSPWWALAAGILTGLSTFVSFSLLPVLGAALAWLALDLPGRDKNQRGRGVLMLVVFLAGMLLFYGWLNISYGYNPVVRYQAAMASHKAQKLFRPGALQVVQALLVNNLEYAVFSGMGLAALFVYRFRQAFWRKRLGEITLFEGLLLAVSAAYLVTNLIGQTIGEVGRIWMFYTPVLSLAGADVISQHMRQNHQLVKRVMLLQLGLLLVNCVFLLVLY